MLYLPMSGVRYRISLIPPPTASRPGAHCPFIINSRIQCIRLPVWATYHTLLWESKAEKERFLVSLRWACRETTHRTPMYVLSPRDYEYKAKATQQRGIQFWVISGSRGQRVISESSFEEVALRRETESRGEPQQGQEHMQKETGI